MNSIDQQIFIASTKAIVEKAQWLPLLEIRGEGLRLGRIIVAVVYLDLTKWHVRYRIPGIRTPTATFLDKEAAKAHAIRGVNTWFTWLLEIIPNTVSKDAT